MPFRVISALALWLLCQGGLALRACDLCAIYAAGQARGEIGKGPFAGAAEQFTHYGTLQLEGSEVPNRLGQYLNSSITQVLLGYNFTTRLGLQLNAPFIYREFERPQSMGLHHGTESGLGDLSLTASYVAYRHETMKSTFSWSLLGGLKFPTGSTSRLKEELNEMPDTGFPSGIHGHDLTLGSGSFDGIVGTSLFARWQRAFAAASVQYAIRSTGDYDYAFANDLTWSGGPGVFLAINDSFTLSLEAAVSGETKGRDHFRGEAVEDTGVTTVYVGPELLFTWRDKLSALIAADLPVFRDNTALQVVPDYRIRAAITWHF